MQTNGKADAAADQEGREELIKVFSSRTSRAILSLLAVEPTYPRKIGNLLSLPEAEVARRLKAMEGLGLVEGQWSYVGKNIKLYKLAADRLTLTLTPQGVQIEMSRSQGGASRSFTILPFPPSIPLVEDFIGRDEELKALDGPEHAVVVEGMPGIGKTSLVARYAQTRSGDRAVFWHSFRGMESLAWLTNRFGVFLAQQGDQALLHAIEQGAEPTDVRELLLRSLDRPGLLIVFDDVHRIEDPVVRTLVSDALDRVQKAKLIVTGREPPRYNAAAPGRRSLRLGGLRDEEVQEFLTRKQVDIERSLLPKVREEVGGHPLALSLLLQWSTEMRIPVRELLDRIPERNIEDYLLNEVVASLSDDEKNALTLASVFRSTFSPDDLSSLSKKDFAHTLTKLRRRQLVHAVGSDYALPEVIRNFFYSLQKDRSELHAKAAQNYLSKASLEGRLEAMHHFRLAGKKDRILQLLEENLDLDQFDFIDGGYHNLYDSILNLFSPTDVPDPRRWGLILDEKGDIQLHRGNARDALELYEEALQHLQKAKDKTHLLDLAWKRALALERLDQVPKAQAIVNEALAAAKEGDPHRQRLQELSARLRAATQRPKATAR